MSQKSSAPLSKFNIALALLWLVDVVVTGVGYYILTSSNAAQADFYTSQSADYVSYFSSQTGSGLGATLIGAGVIGFIITLAVHALSRSVSTIVTTATAAPAPLLGDEGDLEEFELTDEPALTTGTVNTNAVSGTTGDTTTVDTDTASVPAPGASRTATSKTTAAAPAPAVFTDADAASDTDSDDTMGAPKLNL
jgi:hypothetical protein